LYLGGGKGEDEGHFSCSFARTWFILQLYRKSILFKMGEKNVNLKDERNLFSSGNVRKIQLQNVRKGIALLAQPATVIKSQCS